MKKLFILCALLWSIPAFAHDEGHGPKLTDSPKQGGVLTSVVAASEQGLGSKAQLIYKAELVRSEDGTVRIYLYNPKMEPLPLTVFNSAAKASLLTEKKGKVTENAFELKTEGNAFTGKAPAPASKPFSIDVRFKEGAKELLAAFDNLD